ncbi:AI-2E family transporter [Conyzicola nivalis]|uniref:AI-2E family transporter n=1 Tax=Conyzicola nivalis TaxID=1477021 RepID=A0A916WIG9_9MICO|nr:AI-2E family transporter [Conyzicola nivalis]GGB00888.1 AI-2E family transporter [Conyzicola nivalis]
MKIQNPFKLGLLAGLGVLVAIVIGGAVQDLATILTYIGAAIFLALGLDPLVTWLEKHGVKRVIAIVITLVGVLGIFAGLVFALIPVISEQVQNITKLITDTIIPGIQDNSIIAGIDDSLPWLKVNDLIGQAGDFIADPTNIGSIGGGVLAVGINIATGIFGGIIIAILMIYFVSSLGSLKRGIYQLVPASKRANFIDLAEQISESVGRFVMGQITLAIVNGALSFIVLTALGVKYSALLAFIAFLGSTIPLVGTLSASVIISLCVLLFNGADWHVVVVAIYYAVYMQVEAYILSPRIMARAVKVPGVVVVIAALVGGTLLGILGALIAIPVAAAVQLIIKEVVVPKQNAL